ncbi:hypothetical protein OS188_14560 [Xanthomarina sp. F1114]|uniref:hypothetical protein n=1 Tax=unclassified Xanthomarina TaxID=2649071 RepID=UPI00225E5F6B|nr:MULTISPECIES: hypothetical protein [unclassified Xanthomarina]MCX7549176.1 hypothetical protein [Xanthomarina sp. F1114]MCX7552090.1 hypothetical protein [Xanthomarina sp. F2636L]
MKKIITILLILTFGLFSCESEKKYSDYNEADFYEVQGIINSAIPTSNTFDNPIVKDIRFTYFLDYQNPKKGIERNLKMFEAKNGYPLIVLVHKDDENISFYGRVGILENLNDKEKEFLSQHFQIEMDKMKEKTPEYIYNALIKDTIDDNKTDEK